MKITGYQLREAIKQQELRRDTAARAFNGTLKAFPEEKKEKPQDVVGQFLQAEQAIARLQVAQMRYNLGVQIEVHSLKMTLAEAIKLIGGDARAEKMWRSAAGPAPDRYGYGQNDDVRDPNQVRAVATITASEATKLASGAAKRAGGLRAAIAVGNAREFELEGLEPTLFE
jgi:hypothetical protein